MFYKLPQVRSVSRYADFSSHLGRKSFFSMIALAAFLHACVIVIIAMMPNNPVVKIPVRVLNFNLGAAAVPQSGQQPTPDQGKAMQDIASPPAAKISLPVEEPATGEDGITDEGESAQNELEKALTEKPVVAEPKPVEPKPLPQPKPAPIVAPVAKKPVAVPAKPRPVTESVEVSKAASLNTATVPRRYVRASPLELTQPAAAANTAPAGPEEIVQRYEQAISVWVGRYKVYPDEAKRRRVEGRPTVRVRINRQGKVLYNAIEKSSGDAFLDQALMNMVKAADPMPAVPENYPQGEELEFLIPVSFSLKGQ